MQTPNLSGARQPQGTLAVTSYVFFFFVLLCFGVFLRVYVPADSKDIN